MGSTERLHLRWNDFESNIKLGFSELRKDEEFFDLTIACGSKQIKAHKVILSACSPFFRSIIKSIPHQHPFLYLRGIKAGHLESLLCFMYNGEVSVTQDELNSFLSVAEELQIKGLTQNPSQPPPSSAAEGPPIKRSRVMNKSESNAHSQHQSSAMIVEDDDIQEVTLIKTERKYIPPRSASETEKETQNYGEDLNEEKYIADSEYMPESEEADHVNDDSLLGPGAPEPSTTPQSVNENEDHAHDMNKAFDLEIEKCIKKFGPKQFGCVKCNYRASLRNMVKSHAECNHFITRGFPCEICGYLCKTRPCLKMHIFRRHKKGPQFFPVGGDQ